MNNDYSELKNLFLRVRISEPEREHLKALADQSFINVSDYVRRRLFEEDFTDSTEHDEPKGRFDCDHDKELMRSQIIILALTKSLAKKSLVQEDFESAYATAKRQLQEWGYE